MYNIDYGGVSMKRVLSAILCICLILPLCSFSNISAYNENEEKREAHALASAIGKMIADSESGKDFGIIEKNMDPGGKYAEFEACRLMVKARGKIDYLGAVQYVTGPDNYTVLRFESPQATARAYEKYIAMPQVISVEADKYISAAADNDNPEFPSVGSSDPSQKEYISWGPSFIGLDRFNHQITEQVEELPEIKVAVIDSGVDFNHPFLKNRVIPTQINTSGSGTRNSSMDDYCHGTQVAGVIADATLDNVKILPYKVLNNRGQGTLLSLAAGINCAVKDGVDVINISLGFYESSDILRDTINYALSKDIIITAAAGNDATDKPYYPSSYPGVLRVIAVNEKNSIPNFTNYGDDVDFAAPGVRITTTNYGGGFVTVDGTSFAAPLAASLAAAMKTFVSDASSEGICYIIKEYCVKPINYMSELSEVFGAGVIFAPELSGASSYRKAETPVFSEESDIFRVEPFDLTIECGTENSVIYYTVDGTLPSKNGSTSILYDGKPIHIDHSCGILAVAYAEDYYRSGIALFNTVVARNAPESDFEITPDGIITEYRGSSTSFSVPKTVDSITVRGIGDGVFKGRNIKELILPNAVTYLGNEAFKGCSELRYLSSDGVTEIGDHCFSGCTFLYSPIFGELSHIGKYAFENTGRSYYELTGDTFSLELGLLTEIPEGAFKGSAVCMIALDNVTNIGKDAFSDCNALVNVKINSLLNLPAGAFRGCISLKKIYIGKIVSIPVSCFNTCEALTEIDLPDVEYVFSNAFENCSSLTKINLPKAILIYYNAFSGCDSLRELDLPELTAFDFGYPPASGSAILPNNLESFSASKMKKTVPDMFAKCSDISVIYLPAAKEIAEFSFRGCENIFYLDLESVTELDSDALSGCKAQFIDLRNLVKTSSLPSGSGIMLSNEFLESNAQTDGLTVYGTPNTFVERYAAHKGWDFVPIPIIANEIPTNITSDSDIVYVSAVGFNLKYQWYESTEYSTEKGTPIEGATEASYIFTDKDTAPFYYCIITQNDFEICSQVVTPIIVKDTTPADYTEYNKAVKKAEGIDRSLYVDLTELDMALLTDIGGKYSCEQSIVDAQTKAILDAIDNLSFRSASKLYIFVTDTDLPLFGKADIVVLPLPEDSVYQKIEMSSDNRKAFVVSDLGYIRCVGSGKATVTVKLTNLDGSELTDTLVFESKLSRFADILAFFFRWIFVLITELPKSIIERFT